MRHRIAGFQRSTPDRSPSGSGLAACLVATALTAALNSGLAVAQPAAFPAKPITIVVPFGPGGSGDTDTRMYAQKIAEYTGWQFQRYTTNCLRISRAHNGIRAKSEFLHILRNCDWRVD